jgi:hypothetical protein
MNTTTITVKSCRAVYEGGTPRLVLDADDGERVYAHFGAGVYIDAELHYRAAVVDAAMRLPHHEIADVARSLLSVLTPDERTAVVARVIADYHTPKVAVGNAEAPAGDFTNLGVFGPLPFQGGYVTLQGNGCPGCGNGFWTEGDDKRRLPTGGVHHCPHCGQSRAVTS